MNYEVRVANSAKRNLLRFPLKDRKRIETALNEFISDPYSGDIQKLEGYKNGWRRRVGNFRIFYDIYQDEKIVAINAIERRTSKTY